VLASDGGGHWPPLLLSPLLSSPRSRCVKRPAGIMNKVWLPYLAALSRGELSPALDGRARWGLGLLAFQAVGREGVETVAFTLAIIFSTSAASALS
jgi:hypothetical protein